MTPYSDLSAMSPQKGHIFSVYRGREHHRERWGLRPPRTIKKWCLWVVPEKCSAPLRRLESE